MEFGFHIIEPQEPLVAMDQQPIERDRVDQRTVPSVDAVGAVSPVEAGRELDLGTNFERTQSDYNGFNRTSDWEGSAVPAPVVNPRTFDDHMIRQLPAESSYWNVS